jgi:iron complex outermembrane receptor protein
MLHRWLTVTFLLAIAAPVFGQVADEGEEQDEPVTFEEQVVVTASRAEQALVNAPAAVSLISSETIQNSPATNVGELLRSVPGVNVAQVSARDINLTARGSTSTLSTNQLALVDGRSIYLDFFGLVMWDLIPTNPNEIRQIEVIRGPASAVWGANAMSGVVNVITKSPRELAAEGGTSFTLGVGGFGRNVPGRSASRGNLFYANGSHAVAINDRWSYKVSAGFYAQDALARPAGSINNPYKTPYPPYPNTGTSQPKFDVRVDHDYADGGRLSLSGGVAGTEGVVHSGLGPFGVDRGTRMSYASLSYDRAGRHIGVFTNLLNGTGANLLTVGITGKPLPLIFDTGTFDVDYSDVHLVGTRHVLTFGGNYRHNTFDISLAPTGESRNEGGVYVQDEIFLSEHFRWVLGGRLDKFSSIEKAVFSPRTTLLMKPTPAQTVRLSYNRAFRAPSFVNNNLGTTILNRVNLSAIHPLLSGFVFPVGSKGNPNLKQETMTAVELGYTGVIGNRATVTASVYSNKVDDGIYFTQVGTYSGANAPATWPAMLPSFLLNFIPAPGLPSMFTYRNLGTVRDKGIEVGVDGVINDYINAFANYSYQWTPVVEGFDVSEINLPPKNRFNVGANFSYDRYFGNVGINYTDSAYWQDVLSAQFHGSTEPYTLVNAGFGVRWADGRYVTSLKMTNLSNADVQQHVFGDILKRQIVGELRVNF